MKILKNIIKFDFRSQTFEFDVSTRNGREELIQKLLLIFRKNYVFFVNMLLNLANIEEIPLTKKGEIDPALAYTFYNHVDERIQIRINFRKMAELNFSYKETLFVVFHELLHNYFFHFTRMKEENELHPKFANIVQDLYINEYLKDLLGINLDRFQEIGLNGVFLNTFLPLVKKFPKQLSPEEIMSTTEKQLFYFYYNQFQQSEGDFSYDNSKGKQDIDDHSRSIEAMKKSSESYKKEKGIDISKDDLETLMENRINVKEQEIKNSSNEFTEKENSLFERKIKIFKKKPFLNTLKIKRVISSKLSKDVLKNYSRPSRKRNNGNVIYKGKTKQFGNKVVIGIDVSGSMSDEDLQQVLSLVNTFYESHKQYTVLDIIYWSSHKLEKNCIFKDVKDIKALAQKGFYSSGGTDLETFHNALAEYKEYLSVINITDGYFGNHPIPANVVDYHFVINNGDKRFAFEDKRAKVVFVKDEV